MQFFLLIHWFSSIKLTLQAGPSQMHPQPSGGRGGGVLCPLLPDWPKLEWKNIFFTFWNFVMNWVNSIFFSSVSYDLRVEIPVKRPHPLKADRVKSKPKKWKIVKKKKNKWYKLPSFCWRNVDFTLASAANVLVKAITKSSIWCFYASHKLWGTNSLYLLGNSQREWRKLTRFNIFNLKILYPLYLFRVKNNFNGGWAVLETLDWLRKNWS